mmetsp:Transcript_22264/g.62019  ORF Transcript_22264/g.62019 Transcript_22264/m.62019 type:complete len:84 (+) Transcript_22264:337-588(+)
MSRFSRPRSSDSEYQELLIQHKCQLRHYHRLSDQMVQAVSLPLLLYNALGKVLHEEDMESDRAGECSLCEQNYPSFDLGSPLS